MVRKTYYKTVSSFIILSTIRLLIMASIIAICVGLTTGVGSFKGLVSNTFDKHYKVVNFADLNIKNSSTDLSDMGMSLADKQLVDNLDYVKDSQLQLEVDRSNYKTRLINLDLQNQIINKLTLVEGRMPSNKNEIIVENSTPNIIKRQVGDIITYENPDLAFFGLANVEVTVVGIVENLNYAYKGKVYNLIDYDETLGDNNQSVIDTIIYFDNNYLTIPVYSDLYIVLNQTINKFDEDYKIYVNDTVEKLSKEFNKESLIYLTHEDFVLPIALKENIRRTTIIAYLFPLFFMIVVIIVAASTLTRMIEDDRAKAGTYRSLGYKKSLISLRYYLVAILAVIIGSIAGIFLGFYIFGRLIISAFNALIRIPEIVNSIYAELGIYTSIIIFIVIVITVLVISKKQLNLKPANLMRQKSPKPGAKVFLEYIPFIWKKLKFKYKSSFRNILRYPMHFIMTVLSILGSTALLFAGLGLYANTILVKDSSADAIQLIAYVIIFAAAGLSILVTYNLTNMNIEERDREIATLKVLGYKKNEVSGYIYREVLITSILGIIIGLPTGFFLVKIVLGFVEFGSTDNIDWYYYLVTIVVSFLFIGISDLLLYRKIHKINMNESLKVID